ncbi:MAG: SRPBCC family protein [Rhizobiales bacterium]|nr:SRPBCC family protein [Hyphomicrobiales bacterium]
MTQPTTEFLYTTYIRSTPQKVWDAITNPEFARQYWGHGNVSDWKPGSKWDMVRGDGSNIVQTTGEVLESNPPRRLVISWVDPSKTADRTEYSRVTFEIEVVKDAVRLDVFHNELKLGSEMARGISNGWPRVLSGLKSFLETGTGLNLMCAAVQAKVA